MKVLTYLLLCALAMPLYGRQPGRVTYKSFDGERRDAGETRLRLEQSEYAHAGFSSAYSAGIRGMALDLTADVPVRIPVVLAQEETPVYTQSFFAEAWVKTKPGARQGTPIMGNRKCGDTDKAGWLLGTDDRGAWFFTISDGKTSYSYEPTAERQAINDGAWHHLAVSIDLEKMEGWFYFDGRNVAVYNLAGLTGAVSACATVIGGSDEYNDWGSRREWTAFNGWIDEVRIGNGSLAPAEVRESYVALLPAASPEADAVAPDRLKVQVWNIWHGGRRFGKHVGVERVIGVLKENKADVIGLIETYGSGAVIADSLGYYFYLISSNLSIMSRFPIEKTIPVFRPFYSGGALLELGGGRKLAFFDLWLSASPDICDLSQGKQVVARLAKEEEKTRRSEIRQILSEIGSYTARAEEIPVLAVGDFNCGSHLDWNARTKEFHNGLVVDWPVSRYMSEAGFTDSFREVNPDPLQYPGVTWSPLINGLDPYGSCMRDRLDFIYYKGGKLSPFYSRVFDFSAPFWPSDHGSVVTWFYFTD